MQKFSLFIKSDKFYWSTNKIIYSTLFFCLAVILIKDKVFKIEENLFDKIFQYLMIGCFIIGLILKFKGFTEIEPLRGKLDGSIVFNKDSISVKDEIFQIDEVRKIQISNDDYNGRLNGTSKGNFGPALSNGTNNFIVIFFESGISKRYQFELINSDDFQKIRNILIEYHLKGKMDFDEIANVLGEKSSEEIRDFKNEIIKAQENRA